MLNAITRALMHPSCYVTLSSVHGYLLRLNSMFQYPDSPPRLRGGGMAGA
jgi:hypothetical protein